MQSLDIWCLFWIDFIEWSSSRCLHAWTSIVRFTIRTRVCLAHPKPDVPPNLLPRLTEKVIITKNQTMVKFPWQNPFARHYICDETDYVEYHGRHKLSKNIRKYRRSKKFLAVRKLYGTVLFPVSEWIDRPRYRNSCILSSFRLVL